MSAQRCLRKCAVRAHACVACVHTGDRRAFPAGRPLGKALQEEGWSSGGRWTGTCRNTFPDRERPGSARLARSGREEVPAGRRQRPPSSHGGQSHEEKPASGVKDAKQRLGGAGWEDSLRKDPGTLRAPQGSGDTWEPDS